VASASTTEGFTAVARTRVFFGHQSVGMNVLDAVPDVYADHGVSAPPIEQGRTEPGPNGGFIAHQFIGENGKPLLKLEDFDHAMRGGMGRQVDVALMNLDVRSGMDVDALFARYRDTMGASARDFPNVTFIHVTVPLNTDALEWAKAGNVARERFNALIRGEYAGHHLFDIAAIESTKPDGTRVSGSYDNQGYFALYDRYASDVRGPPQRGWCQDRGDSLSRRDRAGIAECRHRRPALLGTGDVDREVLADLLTRSVHAAGRAGDLVVVAGLDGGGAVAGGALSEAHDHPVDSAEPGIVDRRPVLL
jgi:hypothetical protein